MVYSGADHDEGIVHVGEVEEGFALGIGGRNVGRIQARRVIVEDAEEVVVVTDKLVGGRCVSLWRDWQISGGGIGVEGEICH